MEIFSNVKIPDLKSICKDKNIKGYSGLNKENLIRKILNIPLNVTEKETSTTPITTTTTKIIMTTIQTNETKVEKKRKISEDSTVKEEEKKSKKPKKETEKKPKKEQEPKEKKPKKEQEPKTKVEKKSKPEFVLEPNCNCNLKSTKRVTKKDGPNQGREFYTCEKSKCNFFLWAN